MKNKSLPAARVLELHRQLNAKIDACLLAFRTRALEQFEYTIQTNIPRGILSDDEAVDNALESGFVGAAAAENKWGVEATVKLAIAILEDANCHAECRAIDAVQTTRAAVEAGPGRTDNMAPPLEK